MTYELRKKNIWDVKRQQGKFVREQEEGIIPSEDQVQDMIDEAVAERVAGDIDAFIDRSITEIESNATSVGTYGLAGCVALTTAVFPLATSVGEAGVGYCPALTTADFSSITNIGNMAFYGCSALTALILRKADAICTLGNMMPFDNSPIETGTGYIYVPSALVDTYKADSVWSTFANQFRALEDYTVDGTITGELDPDKI